MIGSRLKEERLRLGLTQVSFAEKTGMKSRTLIDWERGISSPTAVQLRVFSDAGMDVHYVITGKHQQGGIGEAAVHQAVLDAVDLLSLEDKVDAAQLAKAVVKLVAKSVSDSQPAAGQVTNTNSGDGAQLNFNGPVGTAFSGDATIMKGSKKP
ncbi:TPA: helix-turn-helix domain-containing protein [Aeromonas veronii bv. veronii]|nr:helix-turn-helix domain-containing protein [Aeromonas veronii bv. veronii]